MSSATPIQTKRERTVASLRERCVDIYGLELGCASVTVGGKRCGASFTSSGHPNIGRPHERVNDFFAAWHQRWRATSYILSHNRDYGGPEPPPIDHDGVNDVFAEKASVVHYFYRGRWLALTGAD